MERHVLVIFPHPDDEAFGVSGTLAEYVKQGVPVTYACLTLGEMGRNMGKPIFANRETLKEFRRQELKAACKAIGIQDLRMLGYRDKTVEFEDEEKLADHLGSIIAEVNPSLVITFYPGYSVHPDHDATGAAVVRAIGRLAESERPVLQCVAFSHDCVEVLGEPDVVNDVRGAYEQKLDTLRAHRSQTEGLLQMIDEKGPEEFPWFKYERFWTYRF